MHSVACSRSTCAAIALLCVVYLLVSLVHFRLTHTQHVEPVSFSIVPHFSKEVDEEWVPALAHQTIDSCVPYKSRDAYADKFLVFIGGKKAMLKLVEKHSLLDRAFRVLDFTPGMDHEGAIRAESGAYQGVPELVAWHVDRVLNLYRKPPIVGRYVSNKMLYPSFWASLLPSYEVPVTIHGWIDGLYKEDPDVALLGFLARDMHPIPPYLRETLLHISDVLVFDYLVDDHDRAAEKNWMKLRPSNEYILWDNGLAFNHGPAGPESCLDILCGSNKWRRSVLPNPCSRICVFRKTTIDQLVSVGPSASESAKLGFRLRESLESDLLHPHFHFPIYYTTEERREIVRFSQERFFEGMDHKVEMLLHHVDACVATHGREKVLL